MTQRLFFPYQFDGRGLTREADEADWIRGLVEQVLFTAPGERVMRPDFGSGLRELVFAPNSPELAATTQFLVQGALQRWLSGLITVEAVEVRAVDAALSVTVQYLIRRNASRQRETFTQGGQP
ncbi:GPW/gp25 family protein [Hydrogenophaga taeniospiralis]|jgi:phage baseplate assembly protein W|uniref:Phage baseplate assembly protein W n=1 Tax=Hydrogenophaga taeniospiralis CCUG 15921 TaxID=1281780 RepID=A0A9X4SCB5_9BURK|nr:GPW/gp25 family protein [Hydrogenophaga taeniospiralis]MBW8316470.1 GPW/gp25 family protein [Hydrogenophaga sp.]MCB4365026.1 GPW/gp25 family protein [Hydrogenophaga taeniospiralis]MDG5976473.1 phage baseplate assembly protein W [Hydrogenophaga taeniospiralis CCUG 15921]